MRMKLLYAGIIGFGVLAGLLIIGATTSAQTINDANVRYPVAELGNCANQGACKTYCDDPAHAQACLAYAQKNNLMSQDEIAAAQKFLDAGGKGPGGCTSQESCQSYCNDMSHINECVAFAEKTGILPPEQLAEAKQVQAAIAKGVTPPPCNNKQECDAYCEDPSHMKVCVAFGEAAGFLKGQELTDAKKMLAAIDNGATPPPCKGKDACDAYCSQPDHMEACMTFAQAAGLMTPEEAQGSQQMLAAIKKGAKPPACKGKDECDAYCAEPAHVDECINFSVAAGFMSAKDAEMARKTGGKGPGGCVGKDQCDAFCNNPDNQQTCFNFAKDNGMISPEDLQKMEEGQKQFQQSFVNMPSEVADCLKTLVGADTFEKFKSGQLMPPKDIGDKMGQCFSKAGPPPAGGPGAGGSLPPGGGQVNPQNVPGGPAGGNAPFVGPGGCKTPEECQAFCTNNPDICKNFQPPAGPQGQQGPQGQMQPMMPPQGQENQSGQNPGEAQPQEGMPLNQTLPLNGIMPATGTGGMLPPPSGTQQMMQPPLPQSLNPPTLNQFLLGIISNFFK